MEFPLVSIIVPMYNTAGCIARCVKSICAQTYKSIEILLLNDGSTDDTLAVCRALAASDHRIALVDKTNTGAADTRNQGIALAHGKYIQFVDSDDWLAPDFTEKLVSAAEAHTADLVIAPFWMVYPENYVEHIRPWEKALQPCAPAQSAPHPAYGYLPAGVYTGQEYAKHLIQKPNTFYYGSPCNKLYCRDLLRKHSLHFRKELFAEDQLFNTEYLRYVRTAVSIPDIGYYYLQNSQSVSHSRVTTADILSLRRRVMLLYRDIYTELGIYPETRAAILRSPLAKTSSLFRRWTPHRRTAASCDPIKSTRLPPRAALAPARLRVFFALSQQPMAAHFSASQLRSSSFRCGASFANT